MQPAIEPATHLVPLLRADDVQRKNSIRDRVAGDPTGIERDDDITYDNRVIVNATFARHALRARPHIYHLAFRLLGNPTEAEDIAQDTFVRAWKNYHTFNTACSFDAWVYRIAANLCIDLKRRQTRRPIVSLDRPSPAGAGDDCMDLADTSCDPINSLLNLEIDERLTIELEALPTVYRECVLLLAEGYTYQQLADIMDCSLGTIRSRVHRARLKLRRALNSE
jgi:RNA polymerase sigma-70 factor (ECF subfamily)